MSPINGRIFSLQLAKKWKGICLPKEHPELLITYSKVSVHKISTSNWYLVVLAGFKGERKLENSEKNPRNRNVGTNNKFNPHMASSLSFYLINNKVSLLLLLFILLLLLLLLLTMRRILVSLRMPVLKEKSLVVIAENVDVLFLNTSLLLSRSFESVENVLFSE